MLFWLRSAFVVGFLLHWPPLSQNTALRHVGFSSCAPGLESSGSVAVVMGFAALWIFQDQG